MGGGSLATVVAGVTVAAWLAALVFGLALIAVGCCVVVVLELASRTRVERARHVEPVVPLAEFARLAARSVLAGSGEGRAGGIGRDPREAIAETTDGREATAP